MLGGVERRGLEVRLRSRRCGLYGECDVRARERRPGRC